ncbi:MAG: 4'-phosphopantetheinyl transferase superfamily protein, partial [Myxococcota bacterium]|nr:4'-phosphopantetheinyl transferase superfamily protein [Myxococcota bacterium]
SGERGVHRFDIDLLGEDGRLFERLRGVALIETGPVAPSRPPTMVPFDRSPESVEVRLDLLASDADGIAAGYLGPAESSLYRQIGSRKRRVDWLGGRLAAKRLAASYLLEVVGVRVAEADIGVVADTHGAPDVRIAGRPDLERLLPAVAISHGAGRAVAVLAPRNSGTRVGVDVEAIEPRSPAFSRHVLTEREARLAEASPLNGGTLTLLWTVKEAVSKALGVGMTIDPRDIDVRDLRDGVAVVDLRGDAETRRAAIGGTDLAVRYEVEGARSTAWAVLGVDPSSAASQHPPAPPAPPGLFRPGRLAGND